MKPHAWIESVNCAIEGILWSVRTQKHLRFHFLAASVVLLCALVFHVSALEFMLLAAAITLVLFAELVNTALEAVVDLVSPDFHPLAKRAKDVAAGAVLIASIGAAVTGYLALSRHLFAPLTDGLNLLGKIPGEIAVIAVLLVTILVVLCKALLGSGTPLRGGMPSGHAAVACSIASSIALSGSGALITLLAIALAIMVSHSRLLLHIHTVREVLAGAFLGCGVTLALHLLFRPH
ncbi:MAG: diacylglycerol kinase [Desulfuromonadales bacterium GWD2_61_12]|nr:MAG: diacylglycerol kinase [Desulfuromonadales bacterium GWC2_61_20]OGR33007.1 MAG: diacylglycerol kinase [Desulfuromonadales bacterium GWD2_61_12]HAD03286.1 diacylglycerol kinase [Desulfuromonas sp.]HBT83886.1 diacylglycerol kinase [Desulfuromonas sp.]